MTKDSKFEKEMEKFELKLNKAKTEREKAIITANFICKGTKGKSRKGCLDRARYHYYHEQ